MVLYRNKGHKQIEDGRSLSLKWTECGCGVYGRGGGGRWVEERKTGGFKLEARSLIS